MPEPLRIEISCPVPGEWRVVERSHRAAENVSRVVYRAAELDELLEDMRQCLLDANIGMEAQRSRLRRLGGRLAEMVLPIGIREKVEASSSPVEFFLDDVANTLPVELFPHGDTVLAEALPVLRHWFCENTASRAVKNVKKVFQVLIVADPAEDLPGAQKEGEELFRKLRKKKEWHPRFLGRAVTCTELSRELPDSDILHLAAHYDTGDADTDSGIAMADGLWMPTPSVHSPELVFANCCRAGLTTGRNGGLSLVGRFLQRGSLHVVAPFLPVSDEVARMFAEEFYQTLLSGQDVAMAMWAARKALGPASWVYWHFGALPAAVKPRSYRVAKLVAGVLGAFVTIAAGYLYWNTLQQTTGLSPVAISPESPSVNTEVKRELRLQRLEDELEKDKARWGIRSEYARDAALTAIAGGDVPVLDFLKELGEPVEKMTCNGGLTFLYYAIQGGQVNVVDWLSRNGADMTKLDEENALIPFHFAAYFGKLDILKWFLDHGIDVNIKCSKGYTAIHYAARAKDTAAIEWLLEHGAKFNELTIDGQTPYDWAKNGAYDPAAWEWVEMHGGKTAEQLRVSTP